MTWKGSTPTPKTHTSQLLKITQKIHPPKKVLPIFINHFPTRTVFTYEEGIPPLGPPVYANVMVFPFHVYNKCSHRCNCTHSYKPCIVCSRALFNSHVTTW